MFCMRIPNNPWKICPSLMLAVLVLCLHATQWTEEQGLRHAPQPSFHFMDCGNFCIPLNPAVFDGNLSAMDTKTLWQFRYVNTLSHFPKQYQPSINHLRNIRAKYIRDLKTAPREFGASLQLNQSQQRFQKTGYTCPCTNLVSINDGGRLGNKMSQYMTLLGQSMRLNFLPIITKEMSHTLSSIFPHLSIPSQEILPCFCEWTTIPAHELNGIPSKEELYARGKNIFISEYPTQIEVFEEFYPKVMREFIFNKAVMLEVQTYLNKIMKDFRLRLGFDHYTKITIVGVHNRRTDYGSYLKYKVHGRLLSTQYFVNAMEIFSKTYGNATLFIMVSDDPQWLFKHFKERQDVFFSFQNWPHCHDKVAFDMAVLANADHSIFSFGTFGFWGTYLAGGEAIMASDHSPKFQELLLSAKTHIKRWTFMSDPCLRNGQVTMECAKNASKFGL